MEKNNSVLIGVAVGILVISAALILVISKKDSTPSYIKESLSYTSNFIDYKSWQKFSLSPPPPQEEFNLKMGSILTIKAEQKGAIIHKKTLKFPGIKVEESEGLFRK